MTLKYKKFHAVSVTLPGRRQLYAFPINGSEILDIASVSRIDRTDQGRLQGFQRDVIKRHIQEISRYIKTKDAMIPNAIVIAFSDERVRFKPEKGSTGVDNGELGVLFVPIYPADDESRRPGWIVDGQQRTFAIKESKVKNFPVMVCAFKEPDEEVQAQHFVNVNSTKALPRALVNELLPRLGSVPERLTKRKAAAALAQCLAFDKNSPMKGIVNTATHKRGVIQLNSLIQPLEALLNNPLTFLGSRVDANDVISDVAALVMPMKAYWLAVKRVFPEAWGLKTTESRLMHGVGIWAMMHLMSRVIDNMDGRPGADVIEEELQLIAPYCHWTRDSGDWEDLDAFGRHQAWNFFENTPQHKQLLTSYIVRKYLEARDDKS